ncbi:HNH endonuclease signature motif containing protein [Saccharothrix saharensis]|uniref:HNH endonuclease signature motif containing protein n=1 Tax=Saccharothrix saharensis TaxID=571190 RepID=UPI0036A510BE
MTRDLDGRRFGSFDDLREAFWTAVHADENLRNQFSASNQANMAAGRAPFVHPSQQYGGQRRYVLHHLDPIQHGGGVYDLNNLVVVTPRYHREVLDSRYHYGKG